MAETVAFELVSPERLLISEDVEMVVVPGAEGYFGVLPGHAPVISTVDPGVIDMYQNGQITKRLFVAGGFAEVQPDRCTVLAEEAIAVDDLDGNDIEQEIRNLDEDLKDAKDEREQFAIEHRITVAKAKLQAVKGELVV